MTLPELLERLKAAKAPDRELDAAIFEACGYRIKPLPHPSPTGNTFLAFPPEEGGAKPGKQALTSSMDAITELCRKVLPDVRLTSGYSEGRAVAECTPHDRSKQDFRMRGGFNEAHARCIVFVMALIAQEQDQ